MSGLAWIRTISNAVTHRRRIGLAAALIAIATAVLWGRSAWEAQRALEAGRAAERAGDLVAAQVDYGEARLWRCPLCPWADEADAALARISDHPRGTSYPPPHPGLAFAAGFSLLSALAAAARWAYTGRSRPWALVTAGLAAIAFFALRAA